MKITKNLGTFKHIEEQEYTPTPEEIYWYYTGTHAGLNPDNPYAKKYGMSFKKIKMVRVS
jgi:hypothetical protein